MPTHRLSFPSLPANVRTRLAATLSGLEGPEPVVSDRSRGALFGWGALSVAGLGALALAAWWDFGRPVSFGVQGSEFTLVYVGAAFAALLGALRLAELAWNQRQLPFPPGRYLLPMDFVDARGPTLRILPTSSLAHVGGTHHHTNGSYTHTELNFRFDDGTTESFTVRSKAGAEQVLNDLATRSRRVAAAVQADDLAVLMELDPLCELRMMGGLEAHGASAHGASAHPAPLLLRRAAPVAVAAAILLGPAVQLVRNVASDEVMFADVLDGGSWYLEAYQRHGWRHIEEATALKAEVDFREADQRRTVRAMRDWVAQYPGHPLTADARSRIHDLYAEAMAAFEARAGDAPSVPAIRALLGWLEAQDSPQVEVRFSPPSAASLADLDRELGGSLDGRPLAPVAPYFGDAASVPREAAIADRIVEGFGRVFPNDVLALAHGPRLPALDTDAEGLPVPLPLPDRPEVRVSYHVGPSGQVYESDQSTRQYVGILVVFFVELLVPGHEPMSFAVEVEPPQEFTVGGLDHSLSRLLNVGLDGVDPEDSNVYSVMALRAFDRLGASVEQRFLATEPLPAPSDVPVEGAVDMDAVLRDLERFDPELVEELQRMLEGLAVEP